MNHMRARPALEIIDGRQGVQKGTLAISCNEISTLSLPLLRCAIAYALHTKWTHVKLVNVS